MEEKHVFISHHKKDEEHIGKLKDLLSKKGYTLKNSSIDSTKPNKAKNPEYIESLLRDRISWASATIILIGSETHTREWVNWEIEETHKQGKPIIGVFIHGGTENDVPEELKKKGNYLFPWNPDKLIDALNGKDVDWYNHEGAPWVSDFLPNREIC